MFFTQKNPCNLYDILILLFKYESFFRCLVRMAVDLVEYIFYDVQVVDGVFVYIKSANTSTWIYN